MATIGFEGRPQIGHIHVECALAVDRDILTPELVEDAVERYHFIAVDEEKGQEGPLLVGTEIDQFADPPHLKWTQSPESHHGSLSFEST